MNTTLACRSVFITGGGTGIGAAVAQHCVAAGVRVTLMGRRLIPLQAVAESLGALAVTGDAADTGGVQRALAMAREVHGPINVLVANAGGHGIGNALGTDDASWALSGRLNVDTAFVCAREALPDLIVQRGNIVILSSLAGHFSGPDAVAK